MGIRTCPDCGGKIADNAPTCPHCGATQTLFIRQGCLFFMIACAAVFVLFLIGAIIG